MPIVNTFSNGSARGLGFTAGGKKLVLLSASPAPSATVTTYSGYIVFKFTSSGTLNVGDGVPAPADVFVVGGGASGANVPSGGPTPLPGGTGGTGGKTRAIPGTTITAGSPIPVTVGGTNTASLFGPLSSAPGTTGGSGGSGGASGVPTPNPSNSATPGSPGGAGNPNVYLTGSSQNYAGGGGGGGGAGINKTAGGGSGGPVGGGSGGRGGSFNLPAFTLTPGTPGNAGSANTGGGGGGGAGTASYTITVPGTPGGAGGSGVVVARFPDTFFTT